MRTITNALLTAQTAASGRPHVRVEALDMLAGVARPNATRHYTGAEEAFHHAATSPADGALVRVRMTSADGALWVQRTADPGPASDFSPWTRLDTASTACNVAVCSHGASVLVFFRDPSNARVVRVRESADSGARGPPAAPPPPSRAAPSTGSQRALARQAPPPSSSPPTTLAST